MLINARFCKGLETKGPKLFPARFARRVREELEKDIRKNILCPSDIEFFLRYRSRQ